MNEIHPLGSLIQEALDRNGWSLRHLSKRASDAGSPMSHTNLGRIKDEPVISIKADTIRLLANILKVSESRVAQAALDSMGIQHVGTQDPSIEDVVRTSTEISAYDQQLLTALLTVMRSNKGETNDDQEQPEANPSGERSTREGGRGSGVGSGEKIRSGVSMRDLYARMTATVKHLVEEHEAQGVVLDEARLELLMRDGSWINYALVTPEQLADGTYMQELRRRVEGRLRMHIAFKEKWDVPSADDPGALPLDRAAPGTGGLGAVFELAAAEAYSMYYNGHGEPRSVDLVLRDPVVSAYVSEIADQAQPKIAQQQARARIREELGRIIARGGRAAIGMEPTEVEDRGATSSRHNGRTR